MTDALHVLRNYFAANPPPTQVAIRTSQETYSVNQWTAAFPRDPDVAALTAQFPQTLSRADLFAIPNDRRRFIACLMWGYGTSVGQRGILTRLLPRTLANPGLGGQLTNCHTNLVNNRIGNAYTDLCGLTGVKPAFFTKYMYATGIRIGMDQYPTIYDTKLSTSVAAVTGYLMHVNLGTAFRPVSSDPVFYEWHVKVMHTWAAALKIDTDVLEFVLYKKTNAITTAAAQYYSNPANFP
jgi:hypothetical protein